MSSTSDAEAPNIEAYSQTKQITIMFSIALACFLAVYFFFNVKTFYLVFMGTVMFLAGICLAKDFFIKDPHVIINQDGVFDKRIGVGTINWQDIRRIYGVSLNNVDHVCLDLYDEEKYLSRRTAITNLGGKVSKTAIGISPFSIVTANLDYDYNEIFEAIATGCEVYSPKKDK